MEDWITMGNKSIICVQSRQTSDNPNQYSFDWQPYDKAAADVDDF